MPAHLPRLPRRCRPCHPAAVASPPPSAASSAFRCQSRSCPFPPRAANPPRPHRTPRLLPPPRPARCLPHRRRPAPPRRRRPCQRHRLRRRPRCRRRRRRSRPRPTRPGRLRRRPAAPARPPSPPPGTANPRLPAPLCRASVATHEARGHLARRRLVAHHVPRLVGVDLVPRLTVIPAAVAVARRSPAARVAPGIGAPRCRVRVFVVGAAAAAARALATRHASVWSAPPAPDPPRSPPRDHSPVPVDHPPVHVHDLRHARSQVLRSPPRAPLLPLVAALPSRPGRRIAASVAAAAAVAACRASTVAAAAVVHAHAHDVARRRSRPASGAERSWPPNQNDMLLTRLLTPACRSSSRTSIARVLAASAAAPAAVVGVAAAAACRAGPAAVTRRGVVASKVTSAPHVIRTLWPSGAALSFKSASSRSRVLRLSVRTLRSRGPRSATHGCETTSIDTCGP